MFEQKFVMRRGDRHIAAPIGRVGLYPTVSDLAALIFTADSQCDLVIVTEMSPGEFEIRTPGVILSQAGIDAAQRACAMGVRFSFSSKHDIPPGLRTDRPPEDGRQIVAWGIDLHGFGYSRPTAEPRWMIVQFARDYPSGAAYWQWAVPGRVTAVSILGWIALPENDYFGNERVASITPR